MKKDTSSVQDVKRALVTLIKGIFGLGVKSQGQSENSISAAPATANLKQIKITRTQDGKTTEGLVEWENLNIPQDWTRKWLTPVELEEAKEKLVNVLRNDLRMNKRWALICADHILGAKAMLNAGYPSDYIQKLMIRKNLVQELYETKVKLRERNKSYARASNTIFDLRAKLALGWRQRYNEEIMYTLNRIEKIQQELKEMRNGTSNTTS